MKALIIVDIQNDFLPGGALAVPQGDTIIELINKIQARYELVVATQDWHPKNHQSFASMHINANVFDEILLNGMPQTLWPDHCVQGEFGAELSSLLDCKSIQTIIRKGMNPKVDSYSGFFDNDSAFSTGLSGYLKDRGVTEVHICGLAADFCVYFTAMDALELGFKTSIISKATKPINKDDYMKKKELFLQKGGMFI